MITGKRTPNQITDLAAWLALPSLAHLPPELVAHFTGIRISLEAIFLSTLVLITQNRLSDSVEQRADLDLHIGLLAEHELTRVLQMLDAIQAKLGIENHAASELADLDMETRPEDVLAEIARLQCSALRKESLSRAVSA